MDFVDDEDLEPVPRRGHTEAFDDDRPDLVDLRVRGRIDLDHVHVAPLSDLAAGVALAAGIGRRPLFAVETPREDAGGRRLADAARARKDERLRDASGRDRVTERLRDAALADHVVELLGTPLAGENLVGGHG